MKKNESKILVLASVLSTLIFLPTPATAMFGSAANRLELLATHINARTGGALHELIPVELSHSDAISVAAVMAYIASAHPAATIVIGPVAAEIVAKNGPNGVKLKLERVGPNIVRVRDIQRR